MQGLRLRYQHPLTGQWLPAWPPADLPPGANVFLPSAIELAIDGPVPTWPPIIVTLRAAMISDPTTRIGSTGASAS